MDSDTTTIIIRTLIKERHDVAAQERLLRSESGSEATGPTWRERLALITHRSMPVADAKGR